jgi:hypothetical protein
MANPPNFQPGFDYSNWQVTNPTRPQPGQQLDNDFANIARSVNQSIAAIGDVRRSDGKLKNGIVGPEALAPQFSLGFSFEGNWQEGIRYDAGDGVVFNNAFYSSVSAHVATNDNAPGTPQWTLLFTLDDIVLSGALSMPSDTFVSDGATATFELSFTPVSQRNLLITIGGQLQAVSEYTVSGNSVIFDAAPPVGPNGESYLIEVRGFATTSGLADPPDGSVTEAKLSAAVAAKLNGAAQTSDFGTAAFEDATDFATAAQGTRADSAIQPNAPLTDLAETSTVRYYTNAEKLKLDGVASGATANATNAQLRDRATHTGTQSADTVTDSATRIAMTPAERTKLSGVASGATANSTDAQLRDRATHTGTQAQSTVVNLVSDLAGKATTAQGAKADTAMQPSVYDPTNKAASPFLSSNTDFPNPDTGGTTLSVYDVLRALPTIANFAGTVSAKIAAMAAAYGFVVFPRGDTAITVSTAINVPIYFQPGARVAPAAGVTLTLRGQINADRRQQIFTGSGNISLNYSNPNGEDTKYCHVAWWGIFPRGADATDIGPALQKCLDSFGNTREGVLEFDGGAYTLGSGVTVPRALHIKGSGIRRTTFDLLSGSFTVFKTGEKAVKFSDFQFEQKPTEEARNGILIELLHMDCVVDNIRCWNTQYGIVAREAAVRASITNIESIYGFAMPADSALVWVQGEDSYVSDVSVCGTSFGPRDIVRAGQGHVASLNNLLVTDIRTTETSISVNVVADTGSVRNVCISNVIGDSDGAVAVVQAKTFGSASIESLSINAVVADNSPISLIKLEQNSSGSFTGVSIGSCVITGSTGDGIILTRTSGTMSGIAIGQDVNVLARGSTGIIISGTVSGVTLPKVRLGPIPDDNVALIPSPFPFARVNVDVFTTDDYRFPQLNWGGEASVRTQATQTALKRWGGTNFDVIPGNVTGTTGTDGNVTLGVSTGGGIRVENRFGSTIYLELTYH